MRHDRDLPDLLKTGGFRPPGIGAPAPLPDRIGLYEVVEQIGEGGMGVVYRAVQSSPIRRQVAVKIILPGLETQRVIARFESEREALARMDHPNIARVLDAGTTEAGRPYFVMEYVDGQPITEYCDERRLSLEERLELFRRVCDGVQHAHQNAIIHRDIKPSNILVTERDGTPVPKIIDFGVAKALGRVASSAAPITEAGRPIGTPGYMSPEQAASNGQLVDTRTDVYSLGVLLYELLTGVQPFDPRRSGRADSDGYRRRILEQEPTPPSARVRALADRGAAEQRGTDLQGQVRRLTGDLDWIVLKALQKEPDRRYASPSTLAADVARYLRYEPVQAGPPSALYRAGKFVRRHRAGVVLTALVLFTIAIFATAAVRQAHRARREAENVQALTEFLVSDLFQLDHGIGPRVNRLSARDLVTGSTENAMSELADRPLLRARMQHTLGNVHRRMGLYHKARPLLEEAHAGLAALLGPADPHTLRCASDLARVHLNLRSFEDSERLYSRALATRRASAGNDAPDTLRAMNDLAYLYKVWGRPDQAMPLFEEARGGLQQALGEDHPETLIASGFLAGVYLALDRLDDLEPLLLELVAKAPQVLGENHLETHAAWYNLGCLHARRGEQEQAFEFLGMAIDRGFTPGLPLRADQDLQALVTDPRFAELERAAAGNDKSSWVRDNRLGRAAVARGDYDEAESSFRGVVEAARRRPGGRGQLQARVAMDYLAYVYLKQQRYAEAEPILLEWLDLHRESPQVETTEEYILWALAQCDLARGQTEQASERIAEARSVCAGPGFRFPRVYLEAVERALLDDRQGALDLLRRIAEVEGPGGYSPETDLAFEPLRGDEEFEAILSRMVATQTTSEGGATN